MPKKTKKTTTTDAASNLVTPQPPDELSKKLRGRTKVVALHDDPVEELRRLVHVHAYHTRLAVGFDSQSRDRTNRQTKEVIKCPLSPQRRADLKAAAKAMRSDANGLEAAMLVQLGRVPIYTEFLRGAAGVGSVIAAYLIARIRIDRATKMSQLARYLGYGCDPRTGCRERRKRRDGSPRFAADGTFKPENPGTFNAEMRSRVWLIGSSAIKHAAKTMTRCARHEEAGPATTATAAKRAFRSECWSCPDCLATPSPFGMTSKYLQRQSEAFHRSMTMDGIRAVKPVATEHLPGFAMKKAMAKAGDLFIWDLYVIWRTLSGLPIYAEKFALERGVRHDGSKPWEGPRMLSLDEARAMVGNVGWSVATAPPAMLNVLPELGDDDESTDLDRAAE